MKKKIVFTVLLMYLLFTLYSTSVFAEEESKEIQKSGFFTHQIIFELTENLTDKPINPLETQKVDINVKFKLDIGSLAKWFFFKRRIGRLLIFGPSYILKIKALPKSSINISISECPAWCSAKLDTEMFEFSFKDIYNNKESFVEKTIHLEYTINENATALETGDIEIEAVFKGAGSLNTISNVIMIPVTVAYKPDILVEAETELAITPLQNNTTTVNITNKGNGDSIILFNYIIPENWTITFDEENFILRVNETKQIKLTVNPPKEFTNQTINFSLKPKSTASLYEGTPIVLSIKFINNGSSLHKEDGKDFLIVGIIIIIIIILLVITFLFLRRIKK
ncbi:MAG: hypothetical protein QHH15_05135 [Candidatus Thermoplasmatota archaeon]|jgi:hypothetical protein|nr:hypothetical protein [Candidatus Thermoplasmatota archaeon]